jgi:hypothetical protein
MNILLLPGASVRNKEWIEELSKAYEPFYDEVRVLHYLHWNNKDLEFDLVIFKPFNTLGLLMKFKKYISK